MDYILAFFNNCTRHWVFGKLIGTRKLLSAIKQLFGLSGRIWIGLSLIESFSEQKIMDFCCYPSVFLD